MNLKKTQSSKSSAQSKCTLKTPACGRSKGCIKHLDFSLSSIGWRRGLGRGGAFLLVSPLLGPLPTRSSQGEDGELDATLGAWLVAMMAFVLWNA